MNRRTLGIGTALIAAIALAVVAVLALGGGDEEEPRDAASATATSEPGPTTAEPRNMEPEAQPEEGPDGAATEEEPSAEPAEPETEPAPEPDSAPATAAEPEPARYVPYSGGTGDWHAELPAGNGWRAPNEAQLGGGRRSRITVRGPAGAVLLIDHMPSAAARFGSKYESRRELTQPWFGSMTEYRLGEDAVGYVLNASEAGPGFRVFATEVDGSVARRVADSLTFVDL